MTFLVDLGNISEALDGDEVYLPYQIKAPTKDDYFKIRETLTRLGWIQKSTKDGEKDTLWQVCHIAKNADDNYYICHFKHLYMSTGKEQVLKKTNFTDDDFKRLTFVVNLLTKWNLIQTTETVEETPCPLSIVPYANKVNFNLRKKFFYVKAKV